MYPTRVPWVALRLLGGITLLVLWFYPLPSTASGFAGPLISDGSHVRMEIRDGRAHFLQVLHVRNDSDEDVEPKEGLVLGIPLHAVRIQSDREISLEPKSGVLSVGGSFATGVSLVQIAFSLPIQRGRVELDQYIGANSGVIHVLLPSIADLEVKGESVMSITRRQTEGQHLLVIDVDTRDERLTLTLHGLAYQREVGPWIALALAGCVLVGGLLLSIGRREDVCALETRASGQRDLVLEELEQLEIDRSEGLIDGDAYASDREELMNRLAATLRVLDQARSDEPCSRE